MAEVTSASGRDFMLAYHLGVEVECKIAEAIAPRHYQTGFPCHGHLRTIRGGIGGFKPLALRRRDDATGAFHCGFPVGGPARELRYDDKSRSTPVRRPRTGVAAAQFAELGWTATGRILEAPRGFFSAAGGGYDLGAIHASSAAPGPSSIRASPSSRTRPAR